MIEHVLSQKPVVRQIMRAADYLIAGLTGEHIGRETADTARDAGFIVVEKPLCLDIVRFIKAVPPVK